MEAISGLETRRQKDVPVGRFWRGPGRCHSISTEGLYIRRTPIIVRAAREPQVVGASSERNTRTSLGEDVGVGGYISSSQRSDEPCWRGVVVIRKELPGREGEASFVRGNKASVVQWVYNCKRGRDDIRIRGT